MKIKKILAAVIVVVAAVSVRAATWKDPATGYTWTYTVSGETATIYRNSYAETISPTPTGSLTIPTTLGGNQVTRIGDHEFYKCSGLTSMTILKSAARIDKGVFYSVGYPSKAFHAVNGCALRHMARHLNHRSQWRYWQMFAGTYCGGFS